MVREDSIIQECSPCEGQKSHSPTLQRGKASLARRSLAHKSGQDLSSLKADSWSVLPCCARTLYMDKQSRQNKHQVSSTIITSFLSSLPNLCFVTLDSEVLFSASLVAFYPAPYHFHFHSFEPHSKNNQSSGGISICCSSSNVR